MKKVTNKAKFLWEMNLKVLEEANKEFIVKNFIRDEKIIPLFKAAKAEKDPKKREKLVNQLLSSFTITKTKFDETRMMFKALDNLASLYLKNENIQEDSDVVQFIELSKGDVKKDE